jgi:hypothetical protein
MSEIEFGDDLDGLGDDLELLSEDEYEELNSKEKQKSASSSAPASSSASSVKPAESQPSVSSVKPAESQPSVSSVKPTESQPSVSSVKPTESQPSVSSVKPTESQPSVSSVKPTESQAPASTSTSSLLSSSPGPTNPPPLSNQSSAKRTVSPKQPPASTSSSSLLSSSPGPTNPPPLSNQSSAERTVSPKQPSVSTSKPISKRVQKEESSLSSSLSPTRTRTTTPTSVKDLFAEPNEFKVNGKSYLINEKGKLVDAYTRKLLNQNEKSNLNINPSEVLNKNVFRPLSIKIGALKSLDLFLNKKNNLIYDNAGVYVTTLIGYLNLLESSFEKEDVREKPRKSNEICPPNKILNAQTGNCVLKTGRIGKKLMKAKEEGNIGEVLKDLREKRKADQAPCRPVIDKKTQKEIEQLRAPDTNRCVRVDKPKGSRIIALKKIGLKTNQIRNILIREKNPVNEDYTYTYGSLSTDQEGRVRNPRTQRFVNKKGKIGRTLRRQRQRGKGRNIREHKRKLIKMI